MTFLTLPFFLFFEIFVRFYTFFDTFVVMDIWVVEATPLVLVVVSITFCSIQKIIAAGFTKQICYQTMAAREEKSKAKGIRSIDSVRIRRH